MNYILSAVLSAYFFALTFFARKQASKYISLPLALVVEVVIELVILTVYFVLVAAEYKKGIDWSSNGIHYALLAGFAVTMGVVLNFCCTKNRITFKSHYHYFTYTNYFWYRHRRINSK